MTAVQDLLLDVNDGDRPSQLQLDREAVGELEALEEGGPARRLHREGLESARRDVAPLDVAALRARARNGSLVQLSARRRRRLWVGGAVAMAAGAMLMVSSTRPQLRTKGAPQLGWMVLHDGEVTLGDADLVVHPGDRLQFTWAGDVDELVLLGADGSHEVRVLWPMDSQAGPVVLNSESGLLEGSVVIDAAPGPELFFAVFDPESVEEAVQVVAAALHDSNDPDALLDWGNGRWDVDVLRLRKQPAD